MAGWRMAGCCLAGWCLASCGGPDEAPVRVAAAPPTGSAAQQCGDVVSASPDRVAGQSARDVASAGGYAAAWGDPPIVLTCGGTAPRALTPSSRCFRVNGVDWLVTQHGREVDSAAPLSGDLVFTTVGRSAYVRLVVPDAYQPASDALVDLAGAIRSSTAATDPCR